MQVNVLYVTVQLEMYVLFIGQALIAMPIKIDADLSWADSSMHHL